MVIRHLCQDASALACKFNKKCKYHSFFATIVCYFCVRGPTGLVSLLYIVITKNRYTMKTCYLFLAPGFEEIEALATADILRRAGIQLTLVAVSDSVEVTGAHGITVGAQCLISDIQTTPADWYVLPGGLPGAQNLAGSAILSKMLREQNAAGRGIAAICASPAFVLAPLGILDGKKATCYPGCEPAAGPHATFSASPVEVQGNIITGKGPGYTFEFALAIVRAAVGDQTANDVSAAMLP